MTTTKPVIEAEGLSKAYRLGRIGMGSFWRDMGGLISGKANNSDYFWALDDVSFVVNPGEVLAVVGANGAGKSTLLKLLSRITAPTRGRAVIRGRLASLLEIGTGFHPDLSGRDNIFLSGAVLGMKRAEIKSKFDQIVEFAGVSDFLNTPVKRYSSGMYLRLAFAVAAHLNTEILLMDEVLAVGDAEFQQRSLGKMQDMAKDGRAVILVSHQMQAVQTIATRAILLVRGKLTAEGTPGYVVTQYLGQNAGVMDLSRTFDTNRLDGWFTDMQVGENPIEAAQGVVQGQPWSIEFGVEAKNLIEKANVCISVRNASGQELFMHNLVESETDTNLKPGQHRFRVSIPTENLRPGPYWVTLLLAHHHSRWICEVKGLNLPPVLMKPGADPLIESRRWGAVSFPCHWKKVA